MTTGRLVVGADVGGTFTDVFVLDEATGRCTTGKVPSTRGHEARGLLAGVAAVAAPGEMATIVHGTTVGTNALLERRGARTGVITTLGFRDVLELRRRDRPRTWGLWGTFTPVVPRDLRLEVGERTLADGTVRAAVDAAEVRAAARELIDRGCEACCVFFVNAYANDANERAAVAAVREVWPNDHVIASSEILPEIREYERASTASLNAYLQPVVGGYLERLERSLGASGFAGQLLIVQSNGGVMTAGLARRLPVRTALSGPAAGVIAAAEIARAAGHENVITCDMGGTSFDVSVVAGGEHALAPQTSVGYALIVRTPMIEITTIGAGGGSIAWVDRGGLLQIGPASAGSDPGPACYGRGNERPTVTDANLVLGRINGERPLGAGLPALDLEAARVAVATYVGEPLGLDQVEAAAAIVRVANARMAGAIRLVSIERGHDPRRFLAMPFGGGGGLHAGALVREVGLAGALVPRYPGVTSALGCVIADMRLDVVRTHDRLLDRLDVSGLDAELTRSARDRLDLLEGAGVEFDGVDVRFELDMAYLGQTHTVAVPLPLAYAEAGLGLTPGIVREAFEERYRTVYGRLLEGIPIRVLNLRVTVVGRRPTLDLALLAPGCDATMEAARRPARAVHVDSRWQEAAVFDRLLLPVGARVDGPALFEQPDATVFLEPGLSAEVDRYGNLVLTRAEP